MKRAPVYRTLRDARIRNGTGDHVRLEIERGSTDIKVETSVCSGDGFKTEWVLVNAEDLQHALGELRGWAADSSEER